MNIVHKISAIIGMRPHNFPAEINGDYVKRLLYMLEEELRENIYQGCQIFQTGMNMGVDIWCADLICHMREEFPHIRLHCFLPCETQANYWPESWREQYFDILAKADRVVCLQRRYSKGCTHLRNAEMLAGVSRLIAVHNNIADGGIALAIDYASKKNIDTRILRPGGIMVSDDRGGGNVIPIRFYSSSHTSSAYLEGSFSGISAIRRA